jgi:hypothetical protein
MEPPIWTRTSTIGLLAGIVVSIPMPGVTKHPLSTASPPYCRLDDGLSSPRRGEASPARENLMSEDQIVGLMTGLSAVLSATLWLVRIYLNPHAYLWLWQPRR